MIFRNFEEEPSLPELNIEASGFSDMITIEILFSGTRRDGETMQECLQTMQQIDSFYKDQVYINIESHSYGCSVSIRNLDLAAANTIYPRTDAINTPQEVIG
jgi:hypothetical protein